MTVKEMIDMLKKMPPDAKVVVTDFWFPVCSVENAVSYFGEEVVVLVDACMEKDE